VWQVISSNRKDDAVVERELSRDDVDDWKRKELDAGTYIVHIVYKDGVTVTAPKVFVGISNLAGVKFEYKDDGWSPGCKVVL